MPGTPVRHRDGGLLGWAVAAGSAPRRRDADGPLWIEALGGRDFIFANEWPLWAWAANLGLLGCAVACARMRVRRGTAAREDRALVWGATALVALFLSTLPAVCAHVALAVQFQFSRVFWVVDLLVAIYAIAAIGESLPRRHRR